MTHKRPGHHAVAGTSGAAGEAAPESMVRIRLDLAYDGAGFKGWAAQPGLRTVEGVLTSALETVTRTPLTLTVAGRTDSGVHAAAQCAHVDLPREVWESLPGRSNRDPAVALVTRCNGVLAREASAAASRGLIGPIPRGVSDLVLHRASIAPDGFDARFSALSRSYCYRIADAVGEADPHSDAPALRSPMRRGQVLWVDRRLDVDAMNMAMEALLGEHDFLAFCKPREGATTIRRLTLARWERVSTGYDAGLVTFRVEADAFCHSMVRSLVGASLAVGEGRKPVNWPAQLLQAASRTMAAPVAPPHGLTLEEVRYPRAEEMAAQARRARVVRSLDEAVGGEGRRVGADCGCE